MVMALDPSRLNKRISFGTVVTGENANGIPVSNSFQEAFSLWCGIWKHSLEERFQVIGTEHQDDVTVIIRHNPDVNHKLLARLNGVTYRVIDVLPDESPDPVSFDLVTLQKVTK